MDLLTGHAVSAVATQGAVIEYSWVSRYLVEYSVRGQIFRLYCDGYDGFVKVCFSTVHILQKLQ